MLDILANNDWKQPIYFTGGSNADEEYIWLKDYLQLDGLGYKLVPIRTPIEKKSLFDMGRIDPEKMYSNVQKWNWRNINDGKIYLDEQSKRNAISMRNNLTRLSTAFASQGDTLKAVEILDLSLEKMPIKDFDHYSLSLGYPEMYYKLGEVAKARKTAETLIGLFREKLIWHSTFAKEDFDMVFEDFDLTFRYLYRGVLEQVQDNDVDYNYFKKLQDEFNGTLELFQHIMPDQETTPEDLELIKD
jgi:hypothetical protein